MSSEPLCVAVVGGGVCGLTCAVGLLKHGVNVQVYEAAPKFGEIGAGVGLGRNAINVLTSLGVYDDICARAVEIQSPNPADTGDHAKPVRGIDDMRGWFKYYTGLGDHKLLSDYGAQEDVSQGVHRAAFMDALVQHVDPQRAHFNKRCTHLTEKSNGKGIIIHFQDGSTAEADIVLGADGIKSVVRRYTMDTASLGTDPNVKFSNTMCYRSLVPVTRAAEAGCTFDYGERSVCFVGKNKHLILFTVRGRTLINIVAFVSDPNSSPDHYQPPPLASVQQVTKQEVLEAYEGWGPEVTNLLSCMDNPTKWSISVVHPPIKPENWTRGPVAILGDAAHGMLPHLGAGAGQGLEDAYLLGQLLGHPQTNSSNVEAILRVYASVRQPRAYHVWENSRRAGDIWDSRAGYDGINIEEVKSLWNYIWYHPVDADFQAAEEVLIKEGVFKKSQAAL